jgi:hypothetical protein
MAELMLRVEIKILLIKRNLLTVTGAPSIESKNISSNSIKSLGMWEALTRKKLRNKKRMSCKNSMLNLYSVDVKKFSVGVSTSGKSADFDSAMRRFEPCHPYHLLLFSLRSSV